MKRHHPRDREGGAALLAIMLVVVVAASFVLITNLNSSVGRFTRQGAGAEVLSEAKAALISYALRYPEDVNSNEGPGYLPCPDISNNGQAGGSCSLSGTNTTIGRLPFKTLEISDLRDHAGERLWYVVSENYKNNPKVLAALNTDSPGTLTLDGNSDIVAVIFAPGEPMGNQDRSSDPLDAANYLEDDNADDDVDFVSRAAATFNDQVIAITRQELMSVVEKRVLGDVRRALSAYQSTYSAYPWLTPFADPKASFRNLRGSHGGGNNSASLTDNSVDFTDWGVQAGDTVINLTDGSMGTVSASGVSASTLTLNGLTLGDENLFDTDDEYAVVTVSNPGLLTGVATSGSNSLVLNDTSKDFVEIGVSPGDIIDNLTDGSAGAIESVSATSITVADMTGGTNNTFSVGDDYRIRSNRGSHTGANDSTTLADANTDFTVMGIQAGDMVVNLSDGSMGRVDTIAANTLTFDSLDFGPEDRFDTGDLYYIPRFNTDNATREGLLSFHEPGKHFNTEFSLDWELQSGTSYDYSSDIQTGYRNEVTQDISTPGTTFTVDNGVCVWMREEYVECYGVIDDYDETVSGTVTSGSNTNQVDDSTRAFQDDGVKRGDIIQNFNDENDLSSNKTVDSGNCGTATAGSSNLTLNDSANNFLEINVSVGDLITNTTDGSSGTVESVSANQITVVSLSGGSDNTFAPGDDYQIAGDPRLYDADANLLSYQQDGPYELIVRNNSTGVQGVVRELVSDDELISQSYPNTSPICFASGDSYRLRRAQEMVVTSVPSNTRLLTATLTGTSPDFDTGEYYRVKSAAKSFSDRVDDTFLGGDIFMESGDDLIAKGVEVGDVVSNTTNDDAYGRITWIAVISGNTYVMVDLYGGDGGDAFDNNDDYVIYYNYVHTREYQFRARFNGGDSSPLGQDVYSVNGVRKRSACIGYGLDCSSGATASAMPYNLGVPLITIIDYEKDGDEAATTTATIPSSGTPTGSVKVTSIDYYLSEENDELPVWFAKNKWHQLIYVAYSNGLTPGGAGNCTSGINCLVIGGSFNTNNKEAIVLAAGTQLDEDLCPGPDSQDRTKARLCDYFEDENQTVTDDTFFKDRASGTFNDKLLVVSPPLF